MCGIAGQVGLQLREPEATARALAGTLRHRGPDSEGWWVGPDVALAMTRLAIIDVQGGEQPRTVGPWKIVVNGELYNYRELRAELTAAGQVMSGDGDSEVVAQAVAAWGEAAFARFDGMYAVAAWNTTTHQLLLARDRFGEKPLYLWRRGAGLAFASEPKALRVLGRLPGIDPASLARYLHLGWVPSPQTIWQDIESLPPGHQARWAEGRLVVRPTRTTPAEIGTEDAPAGGAGGGVSTGAGGDPVDELDRRLREAVASRLVADVEVGVLLSGGIDSSLVAAQAVRLHPGIATFSIAVDDPLRDESRWSRAVAASLGTDHHELRVGEAEALAVVGDLTDVYDEPFADASAIPTLVLSRLVADHVTVALTGDGGDELFSGYRRHAQVARPWRLAQRSPAPAAALAHRAAWTWWVRPRGPWRRLAEESGPLPLVYEDLLAMTPRPLLARLGVPSAPLAPLTDQFTGLNAIHPSTWAQRADLAHYLPDDLLVKVDRASMSTGLELRAPFLAPVVADWALELPPDVRGPAGAKAIPRELLRRHFGDELADRPKRGFSVPLARWLRGPLRDHADAVCDGALVRDGWLDRRAVIALRRSLDRRFDPAAPPLWVLACFEAWHRRWADDAP